tara:strand:- start:209 stop:421 length:213 start_codon:yes stop_codon:yes gene_type:complete
MNFEYTFDNAVALFAWLVFGTFILGWLCGCLIFLADIFTELRLTWQQDSASDRTSLSRFSGQTQWRKKYD